MSQIQIPKGWNCNEFHNLTKSFDGLRIPLNKSQRSTMQGRYPYYGASGQVDSINDYKFDGAFLLIAEDGENLNSRKKPIAYIVKGKFWVNNHAHVVQTNDELDLNFLQYYINNLDIMNYAKKQSTRPKLNKSVLERIPVIYPDKLIQKKIVQKLDHILGQLEEKKKEILEVYHRIHKEISKIHEISSKYLLKDYLLIDNPPSHWEICEIEKILDLNNGKAKTKSQLDADGKYPVFGGNGITGYSNEYLVDHETIVIGRVGAYCGSIHMTPPKSWITDNAMYCTFKIKTNLEYLMLLFEYLNFNKHSKINAQPSINQEKILSTKILYPPINEQNEIVMKWKNANEKLQTIKTTISEIETAHNIAKNYLTDTVTAILNHAFSGKLVN